VVPPTDEGKKPPPLEEEEGPTRMSEPDGDLLAMLQRAREVDQAAPESIPRRRRGKTNAVTTEPDEEDVPTMVRTDISVEELEVRAQAEAKRASVPDEPVLEPITPRPGTLEPTPERAASEPATSERAAPLGAPPRTTPERRGERRPDRSGLWVFLVVLIVCSVAVVLLLRASP
jgi:hypothetical protein